MPTAYTSLLGLALPVTGELSGTWGDTVNNSITSLLDTSVAGTTNVSTDADVTLTTTTGASNTSRQAILLFSGARTALRTVTAPAQSKIYTVINATTGGFAVKLVGAGPTTGLTIPNGASAIVAWNGSDFIEIGTSSIGNLVVNGTLTVTGATTLQSTLAVTGATTLSAALTYGGVTLSNAVTGTGNMVLATSPTLVTPALGTPSSGVVTNLTGTASININGTVGATTASTGAFTTLSATGAITSTLTTGTAPLVIASTTKVTNLNVDSLDGADWASPAALGSTTPAAVSATTLTTSSTVTFNGGTANGVAYLNGSKVVTSGSALVFDGGNLGLGVTPSASTLPTIQSTYGVLSGNTNISIVRNAYYNSGWKYTATGAATFYQHDGGSHIWYNAPSGTAGDAITFTQAMTLDASSNLGIGTTSPAFGLSVQKDNGSGYIALFRKSVSDPPLTIQTTSSITQLQGLNAALSATNDIAMQLSGSNVGIGTSSPSQKLDVNGNITSTAWLGRANGSAPSADCAIYRPADNTLGFSTASAEQMRLTSTGLGIGTSSPAYKLQVASGATAATSYFSSTATPAYSATAYNGGNARIAMNGGSASGATTGINFSQGGSFEAYFGGVQESGGAAAFVWQGYSGSAYAERMRLDSSGNLGIGTSSPGEKLDVVNGGLGVGNGTIKTVISYSSLGLIGTTSNHAIGFLTNNTERARIDSSGNLLVGTTTAGGEGWTLYPTGSGGGVLTVWNRPATANTTTALEFRDGGTAKGSITYTNTATAFNTSSDYRLKNTIAPMTGALAKVALLKPCTYKWNEDGSNGQGFIAHELAEVVPQCVTGEKDAVDAQGNPQYQGIDVSFLVATLTAAIKEQQAIIESLKARLDAANL